MAIGARNTDGNSSRDLIQDRMYPASMNARVGNLERLRRAYAQSIGSSRAALLDPDEYFGSGTPTSGTYKTGDIIWNTSPASGVYSGWRCTVGGTPGTWVGFGLTGVLSVAQHGALSDGSLHAVASQSVAGFMAAADKYKVDGVAAWAGQSGAASIFAAYADGDPARMAMLMTSNAAPAAAPSNTGIPVARAVRFRLPRALTVASIYVHTIATLASTLSFAIYPATAGSSRLWQSGTVSSTANTWLTMAASFALAANTSYWFAVAVNSAASSTAVFRTIGPPIQTSQFGADVGPLSALNIGIGELVEFAVASGAFPSTLPALAAAGASGTWTGGVPFAVLQGTAS